MARTGFTFKPLTPDRWPDVEKLFGPKGACAGCWCMWWRLPRKAWEAGKGKRNREAFRKIVDSGTPPGVLAYEESEPVGWCAIGPRDEYSALARSRVLAPVDEKPVWSITCLFVARSHRNRGLSSALARAAADLAGSFGAKLVEAYPTEPRSGRSPDAFVWTGLTGTYEKAGFREVARRSPTRPIVRKRIR